MQALPALRTHAAKLRLRASVRRVWDYHLSGVCSTPREQPQCCGCGGNHIANYRDCVKWKEAKAALAKQAPHRAPRNAATGHPAAPKAKQAGPSAELLALGE